MPNRRVPEAASLRVLFQEQWDLLLQLVEDWQRDRLREREQRQALDAAVEHVVNGTDARLRGLANYQQRLRQSTRELLLYIEGIVSQLPPPWLITRQTLVMDRTLRCLFEDLSLVNRLIQEQQAARALTGQPPIQSAEVYALFSIFRVEKRTFGFELHGAILVSDVPQTLVSFVGHKIIALETTETALRLTLKRTLFESIVAYVRLQTVRLRYARSAAQQRRDALDPASSLQNPAVYLIKLQQLLASPRELLVCENHQVTINAMGVKVADGHADNTTSTGTLDFHEVSVGDQPPRILCMTRHLRPGRKVPDAASP